MTEPLLERTLALLAASAMPRRDVARGADVGYEWLKKLESDRGIPNPGVVSIQKLHDFLVRAERKEAGQSSDLTSVSLR